MFTGLESPWHLLVVLIGAAYLARAKRRKGAVS